jgi:O-antigen/teichoic acid export membrane protein
MTHAAAADTWQKRYWVNTATNYLRVLLRLGGGIVLFRLTYQYLEPAAFGFYSLLWSLFGFTVLLDFGLGFTVQKAVATASAHGRYEEASRLVATVFWCFAAAAVLLFVTALACRGLFLDGVKIPAEHRAEFSRAYLVFFIFLSLGLPAGLFPEMLRGLQRIDLVNWLLIGGLTLNLGVLATALLSGWSFPLIMLVSVATAVLPNAAAALLVFRRAPGLSLAPAHFHVGSIQGVLGFSLVAYTITFTNLIMSRTDQAVISLSIGVAFVALYQAGYKAAEMFGLFSVQLQDALTPAAAQLHAKGDRPGLLHLLFASTRMTTSLVVPLGLLCAAYLEPLVRFLTGLKTVEPAILHTGWLLIAATLSSLLTSSCSKRILMMSGWEKPLLSASLADALANLALSLVLVRFWGVAGVAAGTAIPTFLVGVFWILPMTARFAERPLGALLREAYLPGFVAAVPAAVVLGALLAFAPLPAGAGLPDLAWRGVLVGAATLAGGWRHLRAVRSG